MRRALLAVSALPRTIVGINGSMVNGTSVIRPSPGGFAGVRPHTGRISGRTAGFHAACPRRCGGATRSLPRRPSALQPREALVRRRRRLETRMQPAKLERRGRPSKAPTGASFSAAPRPPCLILRADDRCRSLDAVSASLHANLQHQTPLARRAGNSPVHARVNLVFSSIVTRSSRITAEIRVKTRHHAYVIASPSIIRLVGEVRWSRPPVWHRPTGPPSRPSIDGCDLGGAGLPSSGIIRAAWIIAPQESRRGRPVWMTW